MSHTRTQPDQRFLVINGDDFGFSHGVNQAILKAHCQGILTSTSLMVSGDAFTEAVELARTNPTLAVGLHLVLVCGKSVLPPDQIPRLVNAAGEFPSDPVRAGCRYQFSQVAQKELRLEIRAQLERFRQTGLPLSHVDGHLHLHLHPVILRILCDLADEFQIRVVRLPHEELKFSRASDRPQQIRQWIHTLIFSQLYRYGKAMLDAQGIKSAERVYGLLQTGQISEAYLLHLLPKIEAAVVEIYAHPALPEPGPINGPPGSGPLELAAFLSEPVRQMLDTCGFQLTHYPALRTLGQL